MLTAMTVAAKKAVMNRAVAVGGPWAALTLHLYVNNVAPNEDTVVADLTQATFAGYAAVAALAFGTCYIDADGNFKLSAPSEQFTATGIGVLETVYGYYLTDAAGTVLHGANLLDTPVPITQIGDGLIVQPDITYGA